MELGLHGRAVIVTGGSSGIGRAAVRMLIAEGCCVAACARRPDRLAALADFKTNGGLTTMAADVTDGEAMRQLVESTVAEFGRLDAVAALAGEGLRGGAFDLSAAEWRRELSNKIEGILNVVEAARPHLARSDAARVVTVTAPTARRPDPTMGQ
jgi:NAD(P)-dependent dehydrogenase (short-subunit alcohol dehydrogenase family)